MFAAKPAVSLIRRPRGLAAVAFEHVQQGLRDRKLLQAKPEQVY